MTFIGIDVSKAKLELAAFSEAGDIQRESFKNTRQGHETLLAWLEEFPNSRVALEATGS